ncbi:hypothetical protein EIP86_007396 [Pleurotus ostreatoroseus]|nr:hypothetical protein EIP86_007396 [Pleurotus ostreatoroseus]
MSTRQETSGSKDQHLPTVPPEEVLDVDSELNSLLQDTQDPQSMDQDHTRSPPPQPEDPAQSVDAMQQDLSSSSPDVPMDIRPSSPPQDIAALQPNSPPAQPPASDPRPPPRKRSSTPSPKTSFNASPQRPSVPPSTEESKQRFQSKMFIHRKRPDPNNWFQKVRHDRPSSYLDGYVGWATDDKKYVLTAPTTDWIPTPHFGRVEVSLMPDGHFGVVDPLHNPQVLQEGTRYPWMAAIMCLPPGGPFRIMWQPLRRTADFVPTPTSSVGLGTVSPHLRRSAQPAIIRATQGVEAFEATYGRHRELRWLYDTLQNTYTRLLSPATFRDLVRQWACLQRFWRYTMAWLDYNITLLKYYPLSFHDWPPIHPREVLGCITTDMNLVAKLYDNDVPVWLIRTVDELTQDMTVASMDTFTPPRKTLPFDTPDSREHYADNEFALAGRVSSICVAGDQLLDWINRQAIRYMDRESRPTPRDDHGPAFVPGLHAPLSSTPSASTSLTPPRSSSATLLPTAPSTDGGPARSAPNKLARHQPYPTDRTSIAQPPKTSKRAMGDHEKEKFQNFEHSLMPPSLPQWQAALALVDLNRPPRGEPSVWRYWVPEARIVVTPTQTARQLRYISNWLRLRETWYYLLDSYSVDNDVIVPLRPQEWREYLNLSSITTVQIDQGKDKQRKATKQAITSMFEDVFGKNIMHCAVPDTFFDRSLEALTNTDAPIDNATLVDTIQLIAWELHEVGFRCELTELDLYLVPSGESDLVAEQERRQLIGAVFPAQRGLVLQQLPAAPDGLASLEARARAPYLEALRQVLCRWPFVPDVLKDSIPFPSISSLVMFGEREQQLLLFYCQTFFEVCGRAPTIPRRFPSLTPVNARRSRSASA